LVFYFHSRLSRGNGEEEGDRTRGHHKSKIETGPDYQGQTAEMLQ